MSTQTRIVKFEVAVKTEEQGANCNKNDNI